MQHQEEDIYSSLYEPASMQEAGSSRAQRIAVATGAALAVGVGDVLGYNALTNHDAAPAPHELHLDGSINMDSVEKRVDSEISAGTATFTKDGAGIKVVTLSEYTAAPGTKATNGSADLVGVALSPAATPALQEQLDKVIAADADRLNAIVGNGSLGSIRFNVVADPNDPSLDGLPNGTMLFTPAKVDEMGNRIPAILDYTLPAKGKVSMNSMAGMVGHEETHIEQRSMDIVDKVDEEAEVAALGRETYVDTEAYRQDLAEIRQASIAAVENDPKVVAAAKEVITTSASAHDPASAARVKIAKAFLAHKFNDLQPTSEKPSKFHDFDIDEGRVSEPDFVYSFDSGLTDKQLGQATPKQRKAMQDFVVTFDRSLSENPASPLSVLDESSYLEGGDLYGHPQSNTAELIGSAENVVRSYPQQLVEKLKHLPGKARNTVVRFLERVSTDTERSVENTGYGHNEAAQQLRAKTNATIAWIKGRIGNS